VLRVEFSVVTVSKVTPEKHTITVLERTSAEVQCQQQARKKNFHPRALERYFMCQNDFLTNELHSISKSDRILLMEAVGGYFH
jgi:hypothetical protein